MTTLNPNPELVDGVDVDAVAAAVRSCAGVDDLDGGQLGSVTSYLPGRKVAGVKVASDRVTVQVRSRWAVPVAAVGEQIRAAVMPVISPRILDIVVSDIADPPTEQPMAIEPAATERAGQPALPAGPSDGEAPAWTPNNAVVSDAPSSDGITPTAAAIPPPSRTASPSSIQTP